MTTAVKILPIRRGSCTSLQSHSRCSDCHARGARLRTPAKKSNVPPTPMATLMLGMRLRFFAIQTSWAGAP